MTEYIKSSILKPNDQIVEGYAPAMPAYEGQLSDDDIIITDRITNSSSAVPIESYTIINQ